ncbi:unnamed protein product [Parajaminaea phylloscopi]
MQPQFAPPPFQAQGQRQPQKQHHPQARGQPHAHMQQPNNHLYHAGYQVLQQAGGLQYMVPAAPAEAAAMGTTYFYPPQAVPHQILGVPPQHAAYLGQQQQQPAYPHQNQLPPMLPFPYDSGTAGAGPSNAQMHLSSNHGSSPASPTASASASATGTGASSSKSTETRPSSTIARSPRPANNSINGARMSSFVFPSPVQSQRQRDSAATFKSSLPHSAASSLGSFSGINSLPAKPAFDTLAPHGGRPGNGLAEDANRSAGTSSATPQPQLPLGYSPSHGGDLGLRGSHAKTPSSAALTKGGNILGPQLLSKLPPIPALPRLLPMPSTLKRVLTTEGEPHQQSHAARPGPDDAGLKDGLGLGEEPDTKKDASTGQREGLALDDLTTSYLRSLLQTLSSYEERERAMQLRIEALAFLPSESWTAAEQREASRVAGIHPISADQNSTGVSAATQSEDPADAAARGKTAHSNGHAWASWPSSSSPKQQDATPLPPPASVLGVRLLRKVVDLQKENDELGALLERRLGLDDGDDGGKSDGKAESGTASEAVGTGPDGQAHEEELTRLRTELEDAHGLLASMSDHLQTAETKARKAEAALEMAVAARSTAVVADVGLPPANAGGSSQK